MIVNILANWENLNNNWCIYMKFINKEKYQDKIGIYQIRNIKNNKIYIGQTSDRFIERYWNHLWKLRNKKHDNNHLQRSFDKYGEECFEFSIIHLLNDGEDVDALERYYISNAPKNKIYNIQQGGQDATMKNVPMSNTTKQLIGEKNRTNMLGKKHSDETKKRMSSSRKNKTQWSKCLISYETAKHIKELLMSGLTPKDVSIKLNIDYKIVNNIYSSNTYKSVYVEGWNEFYKTHRKNKSLTQKEINQIQEVYKINNSISLTSKITGFSRETVRKYK